MRLPLRGFLGLMLSGLCVGVFAQGLPRPSFEVTSVKQNRSGAVQSGGALAGGRFNMTNETLWRVIGEAHATPQPLPRFRIIGG